MLVETSRSRKAAAAARSFRHVQPAARRRRHRFHPRPGAIAARRRARSMTAWNLLAADRDVGRCVRSSPRSARTSSPAKAFADALARLSEVVPADVCGADPRRRGVGLAGPGARGAGRRAQRAEAMRRKVVRCDPLSALHLGRRRLRADCSFSHSCCRNSPPCCTISAPRSIRSSWRCFWRCRRSCAHNVDVHRHRRSRAADRRRLAVAAAASASAPRHRRAFTRLPLVRRGR